MRAWVVNEYAHPSKLQITQNAPRPVPKPDEVLVDVYSAGLNFFDILQAQGKYQNQPPFPFVMGCEFAGRVSKDSPTPNGCPFKPGDRVFGSGQGAFGEIISTSWKNLMPLPSNVTFDEGAGLYVTWPTSYEALVGRAELKPGEWVLVTASAGGVGIAAVQIAKALGAKVIAAAGSPAKQEVSKVQGGADYTIDYTKPDWQKEVMKITNGKGVNVIYDPVGRIRESLKCIAWRGRAIVVGFAGGQIEKLPLNLVLLKNISIVGVHWGAYARSEPEYIPAVWKGILDLLAAGKIKPVIYSEVFPLDKLPQGLEALEKRKTYGKAVLRIQSDTDVQAKL